MSPLTRVESYENLKDTSLWVPVTNTAMGYNFRVSLGIVIYSRGRDTWKPFFGPARDSVLYYLGIVEGRGYEQRADERGEGEERV